MDEGADCVLALIDELKAEDHNTRLYAINYLHTIAQAIGHKRTREELVPYIAELLEEENEEILVALAAKLGELAGYIGDSSGVGCLMTPLHSLASNEDNSVRGRAVESLSTIASELPAAVAAEVLLPVIHSLAGSDWSSARISACYLVHIPFNKFNESSCRELIGKIGELARDDTPMVRRAAAANLGQLIQLIEDPGLLGLFPVLAKDEHDSVRQMCLESMVSVLTQCPTLLPTVKEYVKDKSWRVRYSLVEHLQQVLCAQDISQDFIGEVLALLNDSEPEVRSLILRKLQLLVSHLPRADLLLPALEQLAKDPSQYVRLSVMQALCELAQFFGAERTVSSLLPLITSLLSDENFEVRMSFAEHINTFNAALSPANIVTFTVPLLLQLMTDSQWRVRLKVLDCVPHLGTLLGEQQFNEVLAAALMKWLEDPVYAIREHALRAVKQLAGDFGSAWVAVRVVPFLRILSASHRFSQRMTALEMIKQLAPLVEQQEVLKVLRTMAGDPVPNVKFGVARAFIELRGYFTDPVQARGILAALREDPDFDVRHFANEAFAAL